MAARGSAPQARAAPNEASLRRERLEHAIAAFSSLPERYLGASPDFRARYEIRLTDLGRIWEVRVAGDRCEVRPGPGGDPDVVITTDSASWLELREGRLSGLDAFARRRLQARGNLDLALGFEGLFRLPGGRPPLLRVSEVEIGGATVSTLISAGGAEQVVCLHGLGANKASFFETISALAPQLTVHAIDLPGFGASSKPARGAYDAAWFADWVRRYLDAMAIDRAHVVGNSMGGRIALELGLREPERVATLSLLAPAVAFRRKRELVPLVRLLRPELAAIPHPMRIQQVRETLWSLFAQPERLDPAVADLVADEFCQTYRSRAGRVAFYAAARNIYLDAPDGERGFWTRLAALEPPAAFVWGERDRLVPARFARHVAETLPGARQEILSDCGHVPQVELPQRTNAIVRELIEAHSAAAPESPRSAATPEPPRRRQSRARALLGRVAALASL